VTWRDHFGVPFILSIACLATKFRAGHRSARRLKDGASHISMDTALRDPCRYWCAYAASQEAGTSEYCYPIWGFFWFEGAMDGVWLESWRAAGGGALGLFHVKSPAKVQKDRVINAMGLPRCAAKTRSSQRRETRNPSCPINHVQARKHGNEINTRRFAKTLSSSHQNEIRA